MHSNFLPLLGISTPKNGQLYNFHQFISILVVRIRKSINGQLVIQCIISHMDP